MEAFDWTPGGGSKVARRSGTRITYGVSGGEAGLIEVWTPPSRRGYGFARSALRAFLREANDAGIRRVRLVARARDRKTNQERLVAFYASLGFEATGEVTPVLGFPRMEWTPDSARRATPVPLDPGRGFPCGSEPHHAGEDVPPATWRFHDVDLCGSCAALRRSGHPEAP